MTATGAEFGPAREQSVAPADALRQLDRILAHPLFRNSERLSALLRYTVERTLAGEAGALKELVIGAEVFRRGASFDPQTDNVVRVNANRLRSRLAEYYHGDGRSDPVVIDFPKGRYVPSFRLTTSAANRAAAPSTEPRRSVGRQNELCHMRSALDAAARGSGRMVIVSGDAGLGKTTLIEDFISEAEAGGRQLWIGRGLCSERLAKTDPFVPVFECLEDLTRGAHGDEARLLMAAHAPLWFGLLKPGRDGEVISSPKEVSAERLRREFVRFFHALSDVHPIVLVVDDLHWVDASTCDLLTCLASRIREIPILMIGAYRPAEVAGTDPFVPLKLAAEQQDACAEIQLNFLTPADVAAYLDRRFPSHRFPAGFAAAVHERTEGHPLFMKGLLGFLVDRSFVVRRDEVWHLEGDISEIRKVIPNGVQKMIRLQIEGFSELDRRILHCAAIQGVEFDSVILSKVLPLDPELVEERLQALDRMRRFVEFAGERRFPGGMHSIRYRFVHVFYQNALFAHLAPSRRAAYSMAVAAALAELAGNAGDSMATEIAMLYECGRDSDSAALHYFRAARNAAAVFAYPEAAILCERGLRNLLTLSESRERDARELEFSLLLGMAQMATCGYAAPEVETTHRRCRELCVRLGERRRLVRVLWAIHTCLVNAGELVPALEVAREMRQVADDLEHPASMMESLHALGTTLAFMGKLTEAREALESALTLSPAGQQSGRASLYILDARVTALCMLARVLARMGHTDAALEKAVAAVDLATGLAHPPSLAYATFWLGWTRHARGEHAEACRQLEASMELSRKHHLPQFLEWGRVLRGSSLVHLGSVEEGISEMRKSLDNQSAMRCLVERSFCLTLLAEGLLKANRHSEALALCDEALLIADATEGRSYQFETRDIREQAKCALATDQARGMHAAG